MPDDEWLDVAAAAERHDCSTKTIRRRIRQGSLPARTQMVAGRDGRPVVKTLIQVSDLDDAFGWTARDENVRQIRQSASPWSDEQKAVIRQVFLDHLRDREAKRQSSGGAGSST